MFYRLFFDYNIHGWGLDYPESAKGKYPDTPFTGGKLFLENVPIHTTIIDINSKPVDFTLVASIPIVHQQFNSAIQSVDATAIQRIPIKILGIEKNEYEIMNILNILDDVIDVDQTKYIAYSERSNGEKYISRVMGLKLHESRIPADYHIFRLKELRGHIIISELIRDILVAEKLTGFLALNIDFP